MGKGDSILNISKKYRLPQSELPQTIYIISDMEFDYCADNAGLTNSQNAKRIFRQEVYILPNVAFWPEIHIK